jgi:hypothetical protein
MNFSGRTKLLDRAAVMTEMCDATADDGCEVCSLVAELVARVEAFASLAEDLRLWEPGTAAHSSACERLWRLADEVPA